jgi:hypothetical protein
MTDEPGVVKLTVICPPRRTYIQYRGNGVGCRAVDYQQTTAYRTALRCRTLDRSGASSQHRIRKRRTSSRRGCLAVPPARCPCIGTARACGGVGEAAGFQLVSGRFRGGMRSHPGLSHRESPIPFVINAGRLAGNIRDCMITCSCLLHVNTAPPMTTNINKLTGTMSLPTVSTSRASTANQIMTAGPMSWMRLPKMRSRDCLVRGRKVRSAPRRRSINGQRCGGGRRSAAGGGLELVLVSNELEVMLSLRKTTDRSRLRHMDLIVVEILNVIVDCEMVSRNV